MRLILDRIQIDPSGNVFGLELVFDNGTHARGDLIIHGESTNLKDTLLDIAVQIEECEDVAYSDGITNFYEPN